MSTALDPKRTIIELKDLRELTGDDNGAQRVAFTPTWAKARAWLRRKLEELPAEIRADEAGNLWATLRGESKQALLIGGHIDSAPNGDWLDATEILRRFRVGFAYGSSSPIGSASVVPTDPIPLSPFTKR